MDNPLSASDNLRRTHPMRRPRHRFKPSFLRPDPAASLQLPAPRQLLTRPANVPAPNLVPWMDAYNQESRQLVLHQGAIRAKARNPPPPLSPLRHFPALNSAKLPHFMQRSYSQATISLEKPVFKEKLIEKEEIHLFVRGSASMSARRVPETAEIGQKATISPLKTAFQGQKEPFLRSELTGFKYFNATVIPTRESHKVTVEDVRKYIAYMESRHFR